MAQGQNAAIALQLGTPLVEAALTGLIRAFGSHQTGLSGEQKRNTIVEVMAPVIAPSAAVIAAAAQGNTSDELHKTEIAAAVQVLHDAELAAGHIAPTSALESGKPVGIVAPGTNIATPADSTPSVRVKFSCNFVDQRAKSVYLSPVYSGSDENKQFFSATPGGRIALNILNDSALAAFEQGAEYYVDFTKGQKP